LFEAAKLFQLELMLPPSKASSKAANSTLPPANRKKTFCQRQKLCAPKMRRAAKPILISAPKRITHHCVVMPRIEKEDRRLVLASVQPAWPVAAPMVESATGTANVRANHALKPIQKKISHMPWLHPRIQPRKGCSVRLTKT
jgi:hypothetical protein